MYNLNRVSGPNNMRDGVSVSFCVIAVIFVNKLVFSEVITSSCDYDNTFVYDVQGNASVYLDAEEQENEVQLHGQVSVTALHSDIQLEVLNLLITDSDGQEYQSPEGLDKPFSLTMLNEQWAPNVTLQGGETRSSFSVKRAIVGLLPQQAFQQKENVTHLTQLQATLDLLKQGDERITLLEEYKKIVLVLGNTGAGKSTFTQWIAGNNSGLEAKEVIEGEYIIQDNTNKIGNSTIDSKTTFPELVIDEDSDTAYYDFPGFSDTRNSSYDIAASYFIKKTIDHADAVKILFVVSHPSVRKGVNRQDFLKLLRHATELIKNIDKFQNSIGIVITKVDNQYKRVRGVPFLIDDNKVIESVANFLKEAKQVLEIRTASASMKDLYFYTNSIKLIDTLLIKNGGSYPRIGIFRRPAESGLLQNMPNLLDQKQNIRNIVHEMLTFTTKTDSDFGRTVSEKSKNDINDLIQEIEKNLYSSICKVAGLMSKHYQETINKINDRIRSFSTENVTIADRELIDINNLFTNITIGYNVTEDLLRNLKNVDNVQNILKTICDAVSSYYINISNIFLSNILTQGNYLTFLQDASDRGSNTLVSLIAWASSFQDIQKNLVTAKTIVQNAIGHLENELENEVKLEIFNLSQELFTYYAAEEKNVHDLEHAHEQYQLQYEILNNVIVAENDDDCVNQIMDLINNVNQSFSFYETVLFYVDDHRNYLDFLKLKIDNVTHYLYSSRIWYQFLIRLFNKLSTYEIQKKIDEITALTKKLEQLDDGTEMTYDLLKEILENIYQDDAQQEFDNIKDIQIDKYKMRSLEKVLSFTLQRVKHFCEPNNTLIVKGTLVKLSDLSYITCPQSIETIEIFALNKVFVDATLNEEGKKRHITIIAPIWEIHGNPKIVLDGMDGPIHDPPNANNGFKLGGNGEDGRPGLPGSSGGNFFGVGEKFINEENLFISSNGGDGGPGQNGGNGSHGVNGTTPRIADPKKELKSLELYYNSTKYSCFLFFLCEYNVGKAGRDCSNGGDGGRPGSGGFGGYPGSIEIITLANVSNLRVVTNAEPGRMGRAGLPGVYGNAGVRGRYASFVWRLGQVSYLLHDKLSCSNGYNQISLNKKDIVMPIKEHILKSIAVNKFKMFYEKSFYDIVTESSLKSFIDKLDSEVRFRRITNPGDIGWIIWKETSTNNKSEEVMREQNQDNGTPRRTTNNLTFEETTTIQTSTFDGFQDVTTVQYSTVDVFQDATTVQTSTVDIFEDVITDQIWTTDNFEEVTTVQTSTVDPLETVTTTPIDNQISTSETYDQIQTSTNDIIMENASEHITISATTESTTEFSTNIIETVTKDLDYTTKVFEEVTRAHRFTSDQFYQTSTSAADAIGLNDQELSNDPFEGVTTDQITISDASEIVVVENFTAVNVDTVVPEPTQVNDLAYLNLTDTQLAPTDMSDDGIILV